MQTLTARSYAGEADLQSICDMLNTCDAVDQFDDNYSVDDLRLEFNHPKVDQERDLRVWEDDGRLVGLGQLWLDRDGDRVEGFLYFRVLPEARGAGIEEYILAWGTLRLRDVAASSGKPADLRSGADERDPVRRALLEQHGFAVNRYFFTMERPLDVPIDEPVFPPGITLRYSEGEGDIGRWIEAYNLSFIDHWNFHPLTVAEHRHWLTDQHYTPARDLIAVTEDGTVAGFCFCWIDPDSNTRNKRSEGWINTLGTRRGFRRIGLGRALLLAGLQRLRDDGVATAKLGVDAANPTGALRLYESVGFTPIQTRVAYARQLDS